MNIAQPLDRALSAGGALPPAAPRRRMLGTLAALGVGAVACGQGGQGEGGAGAGAGTGVAGQARPAQAGSPVRGGIARIGLNQEPQTLNPYLVSQGATTRVVLTTLEGLVAVNETSEYYPVLAKEVPTTQNGGVSADGRTVTYRLREGVKWSDGAAFTSADVAFTWEAIMARDNRVVSRAGYDLIEGVNTPDAATAVVRYKAPYAAYLTRFPYVLPKHVLGALPNMNEAPFNRQPVGTGPFVVSEWAAGDKIVMKRNASFRDAGKPYLEGLTFLIIPSREAGIARLRNAEIDVLWDLTESSTAQLKTEQTLRVAVTPSINVERLVLNLAAPADGADQNRPHPILSDQKVRRALQHAIDTKTIIDKLYAGQAQPAGSPIHMGWAADPSLKPLAFDVNAAKRLLDEAGWAAGPAASGGVRSKGGARLTLTVNSTAGDKARELLEQVLQEQWKVIGVDLQIKNLDSTALLAPWASNGPRARGNFDMLLYSTGPDIDPDAHVYGYFHSSQIPTAANNGAGLNFSRYVNPKVDAALAAAQASVDQARRKASYAEAQKLIAEDLPHLLLFARQSINAFRTAVQGDTPNPWQNFSWDTQNWWLKQ
ncbi:MAG: hypothetical protein AVDCRST_MAG77-2445 [uncultured Chloroflexi bacterium]|uniref:Solute-binding protein family 5 domain-containing protein n=1 Tax=uncultured Chloroflexota bacterium TaxID=166587 RepID=A0A6J4ISR9_9CHLR|nr:MAG: hypothetical protein AVDCRST_MAG77-2445 [uncultured Chloroflexota bacterium]